MIARYTRPEMEQVWTEAQKYRIWLRIELAVCEELARAGRIPPDEWKRLKSKAGALLKKGGVDPRRVEKHEAVLRHDVIAFTTAVAEKIGATSRYIHFGLTSSDVVDTALSIQVQQAGALLRAGIEGLLRALRARAIEHKDLPTIGRSHGIFAEPTSFGLKFLGWYTEWRRNLARLDAALENSRTGKLSGAVGVNSHWSPAFEASVLKKLGLKREPVSTQVIPRDRHAELMACFALCGSSLERIAVELRHLQRSEVAEALEGFQKGQKGSSAMPHKRNPISAENISGCARMLRSYASAAYENIALWHERDISHSSVERVFLPDATTLLDYALSRMTGVLRGLEVRRDQVARNLESAGERVFSGHVLLRLVEAGASREKAYYWVQKCAMQSSGGPAGGFVEALTNHREIRRFLPAEEIRKLTGIQYQLRHVDSIFSEVLGKSDKRIS